MNTNTKPQNSFSILNFLIRFCLEQKLMVILLIFLLIIWGIMVSPFDWEISAIPKDPIPVDAIPDIGENQQIVFTRWMGRSPQDVEDQITYPLTVALMGLPGVKTVRSFSMMGFSSIYVIFDESIEFYWSRSRILEKIASLPVGTLPDNVQPILGPDATALGQVFWYTLEGIGEDGKPVGGWGLDELRSIQDWYVRYSLMAVEGVSEVASIGGFVKEYQIDVDPNSMRAYNVTLGDVYSAVKKSNKDVGARTIEVNKVEYVIRGRGFLEGIGDIENTVIKVNDSVPVYVKNIANVTEGPALRRGILDKEGAETVGGVVVVRFGENPLETIKNIKEKINEISDGLPSRKLSNGKESKVTIVPFYDRSKLIHETLGTLSSALFQEILVTIIVVLFMVMHIRSALLISMMVPLSVLFCFIFMKSWGVDANIVALSGIAIAIGTIVDMGIVICENILKRMEEKKEDDELIDVIYQATTEVGGAVLTAVSTTIVSFLPVFTMVAAEGKLFKPLAFTKTFTLAGSVFVALIILPPLSHLLFRYGANEKENENEKEVWPIGAKIIRHIKEKGTFAVAGLVAVYVLVVLTNHWLPLGPDKGKPVNFAFVFLLIGGILLIFYLFYRFYPHILRLCLRHKGRFLCIPFGIILFGVLIFLGAEKVFSFLPETIKKSSCFLRLSESFPGLGREFMPSLDEGSFLYMPTTMPHASIGEAMSVLQIQDKAIKSIPEVETVVGKIGRAETPLDPAPVSMIETVIHYAPEYILDKNGRRETFKYDPDATDYFRDRDGNPVPSSDGLPYFVNGKFLRDDGQRLIPDKNGKPFRLWRPPLDTSLNIDRKEFKGILSPDDIWKEIILFAEVPGTTSAPKLQPIETRIVMLQSGMRAPMGIKVRGPDLESIENTALKMEKVLKEVPSVEPATVFSERIVGKPYLELNINRQEIARYGIRIEDVQDVIEVAIGGKKITTTVEGRERYPVRVRYLRELRDNLDSLGDILVPAPDGKQIPLKLLSTVTFVKGPQVIKSEDTFLTGYVLFDKKTGAAEVETVNQARSYIEDAILSGRLEIPSGVSYSFAGNYENQIRSEKRLQIVLPLALFVIFIILYLQFGKVSTTMMIFSGILVAWAGGFIMIYLYSLPGFMDITVFDTNLRDLFNVRTFNMSVAIWVGFLALFGIATDDGVVMATYLDQQFGKCSPESIHQIRQMTVDAGLRRVRPCLMTTATTVLALIPILTSSGRGSDIMIPMAIPSFGGMLMVMITMFVLPVLYCYFEEIKWRSKGRKENIH